MLKALAQIGSLENDKAVHCYIWQCGSSLADILLLLVIIVSKRFLASGGMCA